MLVTKRKRRKTIFWQKEKDREGGGLINKIGKIRKEAKLNRRRNGKKFPPGENKLAYFRLPIKPSNERWKERAQITLFQFSYATNVLLIIF